MNTELLITLLAAVDAIYRPFRGPWTPPSTVPTVLYEHRRDCAAEGLRWLSGEVTEARRKGAQRELEELADEGMVQTFRAQGKAVAVKLTDLGDQTARALAGTPNVDTAHETLVAFVKLRKAKHGVKRYGHFWIPETGFTGIPWGDPRNDTRGDNLLGHLQEMLLPALARGWMDSLSSVRGHGWYTVTDEGLAAAKEPAYGQLLPALPEFDADARRRHDTEFTAAIARLFEQAPQSPGELGMIPMPVSCGYE